MTSENPPHVALCFTDLLGKSQSSQVDQITTRKWREVVGACVVAPMGGRSGQRMRVATGSAQCSQTLLAKSIRTVMAAGWRTCLLKVK